MDGEKVPRAWIGQDITVQWAGEQTGPHLFVLLDVVPEGLVVELKATEERGGRTYEETSHSLIPLSALAWVARLASVEERKPGVGGR